MKFELNDYHRNISDEELLDDIKYVANLIDGSLSMSKYKTIGKYDTSTISRHFGSWHNALELAGVKKDTTNKKHSKEELFSNLERVWILKGRQPVRRDMNIKDISSISDRSYIRAFGSWNSALIAFVSYINDNDYNNSDISNTSLYTSKKGTRDINLRLRFRVMQRDNFKCCMCGASPAKDSSVVLHIDHIIPWSKGGETTFNNLQTLCSKCNLGKSDLL